MKSFKPDQTPEQIARANRMRVAAEEGVRAMQDVAKQSVAVRENMARLRALRLAKEQEAPEVVTSPRARKKAPAKKR